MHKMIVVVLLAAAVGTVVLGTGTQPQRTLGQFCTSITNTRFIAHYQDSPAGDELAILNVLVYGKRPTSVSAETTLRHNLKAAIALYKGKDILATAWHVKGDDERMIPLTDGSEHLMYIAREKKTKTWKQHKGIETGESTHKEEGYFVEYEERDVLVPPRGRKFATVDVVFRREPPRERTYRILVAEIRKAVLKQTTKWPTTAYAYVGTQADPAGRVQIRDKKRRDGGYILVKYDPADGTITSGDGRNLGRIRP